MARYHFNVFPDGCGSDPDGTECADVYIAQSEAVRMSGEIIRDLGRRFWNAGQWRLEMTDDKGKTLFVVRFSAEEVT